VFQSSCGEQARVGATYLLVVVLCVACKKADETNSSGTTSPVQRKKAVEQSGRLEPAIPACSLITSDEVAAIQKATIIEAKGGAGPSGGLVMSQCYYSATEPNMPVSLAVIQPSGEGTTKSEARGYWEKTVRGSSDKSGGETQREDTDRKSERGEEEEKKNPPKKVDGMGDEAYWSGNRFGGALYVLKGDVFIRISVGGSDNEEAKIEKSKKLAEKALGRLP
jgi:hypothetical protein